MRLRDRLPDKYGDLALTTRTKSLQNSDGHHDQLAIIKYQDSNTRDARRVLSYSLVKRGIGSKI